jgi:hypothetical protein
VAGRIFFGCRRWMKVIFRPSGDQLGPWNATFRASRRSPLPSALTTEIVPSSKNASFSVRRQDVNVSVILWVRARFPLRRR